MAWRDDTEHIILFVIAKEKHSFNNILPLQLYYI